MFNPESTGELETPDFVSKFDTLTHDERHLLAAIFDVQTARLKEDGTDTAHISSLWNKVFASGPITSDEAILLSAILDYQIAGMKKNGTDTDRVTALSNKIIAGNAANLPPVGPSRFLKEIIGNIPGDVKLTKVFRTSFLENPEFAARVSEISNYALRSDLMNGSYDIEIRSIAVDCMNEGKLTTFDIRKKIVEVIGAMYPEPKYEEGNKDFVRYEVKVGNFSPYSYSREESVFVNPYLDNRLVDEAMYAAVMTVIRKEGMDIERGTPFANIDEARHTLDKMRAENFRTGLPNNLSFEDFHKASRIRNLLEENVVFAQTWQDTKANLEYVMRQVRKEFTGNILEEKIIEGYSKGRKEHVVLTDDNLGFRKQFYETLERLQEEESSKKKAA